ncbi:MAG: class I SAM-dependent methyltransferase [Candidatus Riflebacteria bacterium]
MPGKSRTIQTEVRIKKELDSNTEQREKDWDKRYLSKDYPWEELQPSLSVLPFLKKYAKEGASILEIGCGLGTNSLWLASEGYAVDAMDISPECIRLAEERKQKAGSKVVFMAHDFLSSVPEKKYDVIFERGCFHSFSTRSGLDSFAAAAARSLVDNGLWFTITGNADNPDDLAKRKENQYPRVSLRALAQAVEPHFEILELVRKPFGEKNSFMAWYGVFKKRSYFYDL